jgi:hypothetical protein
MSHEAEQFLRYLLACSSHDAPFDLKAHVPRIIRILGDLQDFSGVPKELFHWWNLRLPMILDRLRDPTILEDDTSWALNVWQDLVRWSHEDQPVYRDGDLALSVQLRGYTDFQRDFLISGLEFLGLWGGGTFPPPDEGGP